MRNIYKFIHLLYESLNTKILYKSMQKNITRLELFFAPGPYWLQTLNSFNLLSPYAIRFRYWISAPKVNRISQFTEKDALARVRVNIGLSGQY